MIHIKRILCPIDFFPASDKAVEYAADLAGDYGASIHLIHVVMPLIPIAQGYPMPMVDVMKSIEGTAAAQMKKLVTRLERRGLDVSSSVVTGDIHLWIEKTIAAVEPDLVVMGSHARGGLERLFMGSVAEWLMRNSPAPVLVISEKQKSASQKSRRTRRAA